MCSRFHLDNLKTVGEVSDKTFHQQTNCLNWDYIPSCTSLCCILQLCKLFSILLHWFRTSSAYRLTYRQGDSYIGPQYFVCAARGYTDYQYKNCHIVTTLVCRRSMSGKTCLQLVEI